MSLTKWLIVSSQYVWIFILAFFWKHAYTHRYRCYKDGRFFIRIFFQNTHTRTDMNLTKWPICFHLKMSHILSLLFSQNTHTRTDIDVIKMADFSSVFFFKTRTYAQLWIWQYGRFVSSQNVWIFYPCFFSKHAHTHRYEFDKMADFFHLNMSELLSLLFSQNTHTRTDINVIKMANFSSVFFFQNMHTRTGMNLTKWPIRFNSKCLIFFSLLFSQNTRKRIDIDVIKMANFSSVFVFQNTHTRTDINLTKWQICFISKCLNFLSLLFSQTRTHAQTSML